ncbi:MAG: CHAT domain-containing protein, partial [Gemmataceae bacterium]|nr:CHAT domain-containing protein [Gemmataceae bacterium]
VAHAALAEPIALAALSRQGELRTRVQQLTEVRQQLATLTLTTPGPGQEATRQARLDELTRQERELARDLARQTEQLRLTEPWVELADVRRCVPADAVLIDIARVDIYNFKATGKQKRWQPARYIVWVIPPAGQGEVRLIDLGPAEAIDNAVQRMRPQVQAGPHAILRQGEPDAEAAARVALADLARLLLAPLREHIDKYPRWIVSPDGALWVVPWAALPLDADTYTIEKHDLQLLVSGRDLVSGGGQPASGAALVLADPDFNGPLAATPRPTGAPLAVSDLRGQAPTSTLPRFGRLPGTAAEAQAIRPLLEKLTGRQPALLLGKSAREEALAAAQRPRVLVLATHGFFLPDQQAALPEHFTDAPRALLTKDGKPLEHPLLRCGLVLAGANVRHQRPEGTEDGLLTALEIVGTDLRGTSLVVLSACETGLGDVNSGEGVAGLRQAFQLAGARTVLATLWQIPDRETALLMESYFTHLSQGKDKVEALRLAQVEMIQARRTLDGAAHPFYWAAFTVTGQAK